MLVFTPICFVGVFIFVFIYIYWCPTRFLRQMMLVWFNMNTTCATCEAGTTYSYKIQEITSVFSGVCVAQSLVLYVSLFVFLSFFCWPLYMPSRTCLSIRSTLVYPQLCWSLVFSVMFCRSLFVLFLLVIVLSVLLRIITASDYPLVSSNFFLIFMVAIVLYLNTWIDRLMFNANFSSISAISWRSNWIQKSISW
jgi:hypothetical protein